MGSSPSTLHHNASECDPDLLNNEDDISHLDQTGTLVSLVETDITKFMETSFSRLKSMSKIVDGLDLSSDKGISKAIKEVGFINEIDSVVCNKLSRLKLEKYRIDVAQLLLDTHIFGFLESIISMYRDDGDLSQDSEKNSLFTLALTTLFSYTDCSEPLAAAVSRSSVLEVCKKILDIYCRRHIARELLTVENRAVYCCLGLVQNVSKRDTNVARLRKLDFIKVIQPYMKSHKDDVKMSCLATLANLVIEKECDIIKTNIRSVARLLEVLGDGLEEDDRRSLGWSCKECALAVRKLARNDANKQMLWRLEVIPLLVKLTDTGDEDEQLEGVLAIWALAFDKQVRDDIATNEELGVIELLINLKRSTKCINLRNACERCLWILREKLSDSPVKKFREAVKEIQWKPQSSKEKAGKEGHIMISYQRGHRDILKRIKEKLKDQKYKVWMDVDQMGGGSTLKAMAEAIENACIVLICYSRNYKESQFCQSEAEYAYNQKKPIIPLKMEMGYKPDGWLGILLGEKYFVEFSGKYDFNDKTKDLYKEIRAVMEQEPAESSAKLPKTAAFGLSDDVDKTPPFAVKTVLPDDVGVMKLLALVRQWTQEDVSKWLRKHNLRNQGLDNIRGEEISLLAKMHLDSPDWLYRCMKKDLKLKTLFAQSRLVWALYDITKHQ